MMSHLLTRGYRAFKRLLPVRHQGMLKRGLHGFGLKPTVRKGAISSFTKGVVVFSADFEMSWAFRYSKRNKDYLAKGQIERANVPKLIELFDRHGIPVTWATVGHLFLSECKRCAAGVAHEDMPRPKYFENKNWCFESGDWYDHDPCTSVKRDPEWYAPDLIEQILAARVGHEIGCHTFSHIDFTYHNCPPALAEAELRRCREVAAPFGVRPISMVFPGGTAGNYEMLNAEGFRCYRKPMTYDIDVPYLDEHGLVAIPSSLCLDRDAYGWSEAIHIRMVKRYLDLAASNRQVCHLWFHPSMHPWYLERVMPALLTMVADEVATGRIGVMTMADVSEHVLTMASTSLHQQHAL